MVQIEISKSYGRTEWREDLKKVLRKAGGDARNVVFLFSDTQVCASQAALVHRIACSEGHAAMRWCWHSTMQCCGHA